MVLAANGFNCSGLRGIRFTATNVNCSAFAVELRPRAHIKSDNMNMDLYVCFPVSGEWYLLPHDRLAACPRNTVREWVGV